MSDHDNLTQKAKGSSKADQSLLKHNRNASGELTQPNRDKEDSDEARVKAAMQAKRGNRPPKTYKREQVMETIIEVRRRLGLSIAQIASRSGMPSERTIAGWLADQPDYRDRLAEAYDSYIRNQVEEIVARVADIDTAPGFDNKVLKISERSIAPGLKLEGYKKSMAINNHSRFMVDHARAQGNVRADKIKTALAIAERRLPQEWGREREQGQEVIVFEVPGGWMLAAATAKPTDEDGQGPQAAAARERWRKMRDVTP